MAVLPLLLIVLFYGGKMPLWIISHLLSKVEIATHESYLSSTSLPLLCGKQESAGYSVHSAEAHGSHFFTLHRSEKSHCGLLM